MQWLRMVTWFVLASVMCAGTAHAKTSHVRLLTHAHKQIHESGLGLSGWVIAPSVTDAPDQWVALTGLRYDGWNWNVELMGGVIIKSGEATPLIDARLELTPDLFDIPLYTWANTQWIATGGKGTFYGYLQADYLLHKGMVLVGVETENVFNVDVNDLSIGPHIVLPMGKLALIGAYQFHSSGGDQFWTRLVINF